MLSAFKRVLHVGIKADDCRLSFRALKGHSTLSSPEPSIEPALTTQRGGFTQAEEFSQLVKSHGRGIYRLDTCLLEKSLARAFPSNQAKAVTSVYFEIWKDAVEHLDSNFARKEEVESIHRRLKEIKKQAQIEQEMYISRALHKMEKLNQDLEFLDAKVRADLDNKMIGVQSNNQATCIKSRDYMMYHFSTITAALCALVIGAFSFFK